MVRHPATTPVRFHARRVHTTDSGTDTFGGPHLHRLPRCNTRALIARIRKTQRRVGTAAAFALRLIRGGRAVRERKLTTTFAFLNRRFRGHLIKRAAERRRQRSAPIKPQVVEREAAVIRDALRCAVSTTSHALNRSDSFRDVRRTKVTAVQFNNGRVVSISTLRRPTKVNSNGPHVVRLRTRASRRNMIAVTRNIRRHLSRHPVIRFQRRR